MNKEMLKAMGRNKLSLADRLGRWWDKNAEKVCRVVFFPLWIAMVIYDKIDNKLYKQTEWSEERAKEIFDYYLPQVMEWNEPEKHFWFYDNGAGWSLAYAKKHLRRKDRRFWKKWSGFFGGEMRNYLINKYELDGFIKEKGSCWEQTELTFYPTKETLDKIKEMKYN